jgi:hypothetical protein
MTRRAQKVRHFGDDKNQIKGTYEYHQREEYSKNNRRKRIVVKPGFVFYTMPVMESIFRKP